jgi:hypothetical protein
MMLNISLTTVLTVCLDGKIKIYVTEDPTDCNDEKEGYYQWDLKTYIILSRV